MYRLILFLVLAVAAPVRADVIGINSLADTAANDGECTLREAILSANMDTASGAMPGECPAGSGADIIVFDVSGTVLLTADLPFIVESVTIVGAGPDLVTIDGQDLYEMFRFFSQTYKMQGLAVTRNGVGSSIRITVGGMLALDFVRVHNNDLNDVGVQAGIQCFEATLMVNWSTIEENELGSGFGITMRDCDAEINNSLVANNMGSGINVLNQLPVGETREVFIRHTTISGNTLGSSNGGGLDIGGGGSGETRVLVEHSTIVHNTASFGGGIYHSGTMNFLTLENSIVALNTASNNHPDLFASNLVTNGFNWIGISSQAAIPAGSPNANNDYVGTNAAPLDPVLANLNLFGGPAKVHRPFLVPPSPVVDHGKCNGEPHDQQGRGNTTTGTRASDIDTIADGPGSDGCDIGASEVSISGYQPALMRPLVLLSGPHLGGANMSTHLVPELPERQPYTTAPWHYDGQEDNLAPDVTTDWVLLKLKSGSPTSPPLSDVWTGAAVVVEDGAVLNADESGPLSTILGSSSVVPGMYYLEIDHRNHLSAMSRIPYAITPVSTTIEMHKPGTVWGINAAQDFGDGFIGLWGGDGDRSNDVTAFDFLNVWLPENGGPVGYRFGDFNLSSDVTAFDFLNVWLVSNGQASQVP